MDLTPENVVAEQHRSWLQHPTTVQFFLNLEKQRKHLMESAASKSAEFDTPEMYFRLCAHSVKMIGQIVYTTKDTQQFIAIAEK